MAFAVEQGVKHSAIGSLASEHDSFKKSFLTGHSSLSKDDVTAQATECFDLSTALEPGNRLVPSSPFSLGMSYEQAQDAYDGRGAAGGASTPDVAPCTPCPPFLQQKSQGQKLIKMAPTLPSLCLGIGLLEGQQIPYIQRLTTPEKSSSSKEYLKKLSACSPQSIFITPMQGHEARLEAQREALEPFKEVIISSKLCKPVQHWQESHDPHSLLSLGNLTETPALQEESPANPRNSTFSFLEALTAGDTQFVQETGFPTHNRSLLSEGVGCLQPSSEHPNNFESSLNKFLDQSNSKPTFEKSLPWESSQQTNSNIFVSHGDTLVNSQDCFSNVFCAVSCSPPVKQEWSTTFKQFPRLYQALSQVKNVPISARDERISPEKRRKLLSSQEIYASRASDTRSELNGSSSGPLYNNTARQKSHNFEQLSVREALEVVSSQKANDWHGQPPENFFRPVNLAKVKVEIDYEESHGEQYMHGDSVEENDEIGKCIANPPLEMGFLDSSSAGTYAPPKCSSMDMTGSLQQTGSNASICVQLPQVLSTVSAGGPSVCFHDEQSRKPMDLEEHTPPMNRTSQIDGCWGKFLALSASAGQHLAKGDSEIILPFQRRFKQLQEFLKQCDTSDKYSIQAFRSLSAAAMNGSAVELETRAVRLSLEEGKELKRMKLLNVLGKASEGVHARSSGAVYGPRLPMPGNGVQVKQEI